MEGEADVIESEAECMEGEAEVIESEAECMEGSSCSASNNCGAH